MAMQSETQMTDLAIALKALADAYASAVDRGDGATFAALFTEDGILESPKGSFIGTARLQSVPPMVQAAYARTHHAVTGLVPRVTDDGAQAATSCIARHFYTTGDAQQMCYEMTIVYDDSFTLTPQGWKITRRRLNVIGETRLPCKF